jgi:hypothetical protein
MSEARPVPGAQSSCTIRFRNAQPVPRTLVLEPWGDVHEIPSGAAVDVTASGPAGGVLEIELSAEGLVVYGWSGSVVAIDPAPG